MRYLFLLLFLIPSIVIADDNWTDYESKTEYKWTSHYHWRMDGTKGFKIHYELDTKDFGGKFPDVMRISPFSTLAKWHIYRISTSLVKKNIYHDKWMLSVDSTVNAYHISFRGFQPSNKKFIVTLWMHQDRERSDWWCLPQHPSERDFFITYWGPWKNNPEVYQGSEEANFKENILLRIKGHHYSINVLNHYKFTYFANKIWLIHIPYDQWDEEEYDIQLSEFNDYYVFEPKEKLDESKIEEYKEKINKIADKYDIKLKWGPIRSRQ